MWVELWHGLLANFAVLAIFLLVAVRAQGWLERLGALGGRLAFGGLMGLAAISIMVFPFELAPGVRLDLRTTPIALSGFFAGPVSGLATVAIAAAYRIYLGGSGALSGVTGMIIAFGISTVGYYLHRHRLMRASDVAWLALFVAVGPLASFILLPPPLWWAAL